MMKTTIFQLFLLALPVAILAAPAPAPSSVPDSMQEFEYDLTVQAFNADGTEVEGFNNLTARSPVDISTENRVYALPRTEYKGVISSRDNGCWTTYFNDQLLRTWAHTIIQPVCKKFYDHIENWPGMMIGGHIRVNQNYRNAWPRRDIEFIIWNDSGRRLWISRKACEYEFRYIIDHCIAKNNPWSPNLNTEYMWNGWTRHPTRDWRSDIRAKEWRVPG